MLEHDVKSMAQLIFRAVDTPIGRECSNVLETNDTAGFGRITVDPGRYADSETYFKDAQCVALLKKFDDADAKRVQELEEKAIQTFNECELQCAYTNRRLADFVYNTALYDGKDERLWAYVQKVKKLLRNWLGPLPLELAARFGKGATMSDRGRLTTIMDKMSSQPTVTRGATDVVTPFWTQTLWFRALASEYPHRSEPLVVPGNRFATVPKDCRKRRCIAVEPSLNITYQLAIGRVLRNRLYRIGIDLDKGQVLHRQLARVASSYGGMATLDLSNASDTISRNLVRMLLPPMWYELLDSLRSPMTQVNGRWHVLEKFSSMGNGFTFELETLIFLALIAGLDDGLRPGENLFVYGDDIIVSSRYARGAVGALVWAGFSLNDEKSFTDGPFRESCGGDYFEGRAVRPFHLEKAPSGPMDWIAVANKIYRCAVETYWQGDYDYAARRIRTPELLGWLYPAWAYCVSKLPVAYRSLRGPSGRPNRLDWVSAGDGWVYDSQEKWTHETKRSIRYFRMLGVHTRERRLTGYPGSIALATLVYGVPSTGMSPRGAASTVRCREVPFS